ncbi:MAG: glycosyltransferase family 2 protein [Bacteroidia bacterium]|nr:glycosyltransferase family 2 protein [Bacteroidia bacterium]
MAYKTVTVIIPCRNEVKYISACLDSLINNQYPKNFLEILVINGISSDKTDEIVKKYHETYPFIKLLHNPHKITPAAFNIGIKNATGELIMIASAHATYSHDYINILVTKMQLFDVDMIGGLLKSDVLSKNSKSLSIASVLSHKFGVGNAFFRIGINKPTFVDTVSYGICKKNLFTQVGYYNEKLIRNQDMEFSKRLLQKNKKVLLIPDVYSTYYVRETYNQLSKNCYQNGKWIFPTIYYSKRLSSLSLRHFIPLIFMLSLIIPLIFSILYFPLAFVSLLSAILYLLSVSIISFRIIKKGTGFFYIFWAFITLHFSYGIGSLVGFVKIIFLITGLTKEK